MHCLRLLLFLLLSIPAFATEHAIPSPKTKPLTQNSTKPATSSTSTILRGKITTTLYHELTSRGATPQTVSAIVALYSYDVDFQRDIHKDAKFIFWLGPKKPNEPSEIFYAALEIKGEMLRFYRFTKENGETEYYNQHGISVKKSLLRTPVDGARISSGFGNRNHPIFGFTKMHKGVDFSAPTGTPIYAAGEGIITELGLRDAYGKYIQIAHSGMLATAYAHVDGYAPTMARGRKVKQGEIIAYVGSTGRATGPHLHFEVIVNGSQVDPLSVAATPRESLKEMARGIFLNFARQVERRVTVVEKKPRNHR